MQNPTDRHLPACCNPTYLDVLRHTCQPVVHPLDCVFMELDAGRCVQKHAMRNSMKTFAAVHKDDINWLPLASNVGNLVTKGNQVS